MPNDSQAPNVGHWRNYLAYAIFRLSVLAITVLAWIAITVDAKNALTILNIVLPVIASWVGTIIAFYFGREHFESANVQVRELIRKLTPEERARSLVVDIMRRFLEIVYLKIPDGKNDGDVKLKDLRAKFGAGVGRLPIVHSDSSPRYMIPARQY